MTVNNYKSTKSRSVIFNLYVSFYFTHITDEIASQFKGHYLLSEESSAKLRAKSTEAKIAKFIGDACRDTGKCMKRKKEKAEARQGKQANQKGTEIPSPQPPT